MFKTSVVEACDVCFRRQLETLRMDMFSTHVSQASRPPAGNNNNNNSGASIATGAHSSSSGYAPQSSPPLASLLPQLKSLAGSLLPTEGVGYEVQDISSTTALETLCLNILNSS